jgi:hypothetical protein
MSAAGESWARFCAALADVGAGIDAWDGVPAGADRAEGLRHLSRLAVMALQSHLEFGDPDFPAFHRYDDDAVKWGGPNVDNQYLRARVDGRGAYRIRGNVAGVRDLILSTNEGDMQLGQYGVFEERRLAELDVGRDGTVEISLGGDRTDAPNHVPLHPDATLVLVRVYLADWQADGLPWFDIERLDRTTAVPPRLDDARAAQQIDAATEWVTRSLDYWSAYLEQSPVRAVVNRLTPPRAAPGGSDRIEYGAGWWELGPDETLAIELDDPQADYWSFQLYSTPWFESLDVRNRAVAVSSATTAPDADGVIRIAVGARDPGIGAWLDTEGRRTGMVSYRLIDAARAIRPTARVTTDAQPWPDRADVDPERRAAMIRAAREGIARRFHR